MIGAFVGLAVGKKCRVLFAVMVERPLAGVQSGQQVLLLTFDEIEVRFVQDSYPMEVT